MAEEIVEFSVDAMLLRELGERLVGKPSVALAELIKNSYDADASVVEVSLDDGVLTIADNGHGMSRDDFVGRWMRVGTTQKEQDKYSPYLGRVLSGSKGVGRLAAQSLGRRQVLMTRPGKPSAALSADDPQSQSGIVAAAALRATIDWTKARKAGDLVRATAELGQGAAIDHEAIFPEGSAVGTIVRVSELVNNWTEAEVSDVARRVWFLQPPMTRARNSEFRIVLRGEFRTHAETFAAIADQFVSHGWSSRIDATLIDDDGAACGFEFEATPGADKRRSVIRVVGERAHEPSDDGKILRLLISLSREDHAREFRVRVPNCEIENLEYDIRRYVGQGRQRGGILVNDVRGYIQEHGGVHVFDGGFELGYYDRERDWLGLAHDVASRRGDLDLLSGLGPDEVSSRAGLRLPTVQQLYGEVHISSNDERNTRGEDRALMLQISRDRLLENDPYDEFRELVRLGLQFYANESDRDELRRLERKLDDPKAGTPSELVARLHSFEPSLSPAEAREHASVVKELARTTSTERDLAALQIVTISSLAATGISALAMIHDFEKHRKQLGRAHRLLKQQAQDAPANGSQEARRAAEGVGAALAALERWGNFYDPVRDKETRTVKKRYEVAGVLEDVSRAMEGFARGNAVEIDVQQGMTFPSGYYPGWFAILQNVLMNAFAALLGAPGKVQFIGTETDTQGRLDVLDTGSGVNLRLAASYFDPFSQGDTATDDARKLGLSGTGLGLFIVRTVCRQHGVNVAFVSAPRGYATCLRLTWKRTVDNANSR